MLSKLKSAFNDQAKEEDKPVERKIDISFLGGEQLLTYQKLLSQFKENIEELDEISRTNLSDLNDFIKQQKK